jgi:hypothetical protein
MYRAGEMIEETVTDAIGVIGVIGQRGGREGDPGLLIIGHRVVSKR